MPGTAVALAETQNRLVYNANPTLARFHADDNFVRGIRGPLGSGKSVGCCIEIVQRALQVPRDWDGVRRSRWAAIRGTYPELKTTTIKTWTEWVKEEWYGPVVYSSPIVHKVWLRKDVYLEMYFLAMEDDSDIKKLLSLELTGGWINEARELPKSILDNLTGRVGRYPRNRPGKEEAWSGVIMDSNSMPDAHWWYKLAEEEMPEGYRFFSQPSGLGPNAENLDNLPANYYRRQMAGKGKDWIDVYLRNKYGTVKSGKPVYGADWDDEWHVSDVEMVAIPGREIILGWDWGRTPACIIGQVTPFGQLRILEEVIGEDIGVESFAKNFVKPLLKTRYKNNPIVSVGDPAVGKERDEGTVLTTLGDLGIPTDKASTNEILTRLEAVRGFLTRSLRGMPAIVLDKRCKVLRRGFNSGYAYKKLQVSGAEPRYGEKPDKNWASHPHDALQYLCLSLTDEAQSAKQDNYGTQHTAPADAETGY